MACTGASRMLSGNRITLIGDVHGKVERYLSIVSGMSEPSVQLGDMGLGDAYLAPPAGADLPALDHHRFLRGNHDAPDLCRRHPNYLGDFGFNEPTGMFWVGGAFSVDRERRLESKSWWPDEELTMEQWERLVAEYERSKPELVISHECPGSVNGRMLSAIVPKPIKGYDAAVYAKEKRQCARTRTCVLMDTMLRIHAPERWVFGHYHVSWEATIGRTHFCCLAELETREFEL